MATYGWTSTQLRDNLADRIKKIIGKKVDGSITNLTQFVDLAVREKLSQLEAQK